ncbi:MAG: tRNA (adenosine(37)-N6)-dimethylallyltransferase MiaA [Eubacteriales bacterium]
MNKKVIFLVGPTAVGKTEFSIELALILDGEIVSSDSMQIYKFMDIGSAKPSISERAIVRHYLVDEIDPRDDFSVSLYQSLGKKYIKEILEHGKQPIVAGGSGLYVNSLLYDMDFSVASSNQELRQKLEAEASIHGKEHLFNKLVDIDPIGSKKIHPNNAIKVIRALEVFYTTGTPIKPFREALIPTKDYEYIIIGLTMDREMLYDRINTRVEMLFNQGLVSEVENLLKLGLTESNISMKGIGYKEVISLINGECSLEEAKILIKKNTRKYAKRQMTWFNSLENVKWFNMSEYEDKSLLLEEVAVWIKKQ